MMEDLEIIIDCTINQDNKSKCFSLRIYEDAIEDGQLDRILITTLKENILKAIA